MKTTILLLFTFLFLSCSPSWQTFQANNARTGFVERPAVVDPEIAWKTYIGIQGYLNNSITVSNKVFVGSSGSIHNQPDSLDGVYCLNKRNGKILWHFKTETDASGVAHSQNKIYTTGDDGYLRCLKASNGSEIWKIKREGAIYSQPLIIDDKVIVGDEAGNILFVNKNTGKVAIEKKIADSNIRGGLSSDGINIYATFVEGIIACLDLNGNSIWKVKGEFYGKHGEDFESIYAAPTLAGDQLIVPFVRSTYYDTPAVYSYNKANGKINWKASNKNSYKPSHGNIRSSIAVRNGHIFYGNTYSNALAILDLNNGNWINEIPMGEPTHPHWSSPIITKNILFLGRFDGSFNAFDIESEKIVWQLFLGDHKNTNKPKNKHTNWWNSKNGSIYATPSVDKNGTLFIGSGEGWLYAIQNKKPSVK